MKAQLGEAVERLRAAQGDSPIVVSLYDLGAVLREVEQRPCVTEADAEMLRSLADELDDLPGNITRYTINQILALADRISALPDRFGGGE